MQVDEAQNRLIGSEQAILFAEFTSGVKKGDVVEGVIGKCTDFGAFVKLGAGNNFRGVQVAFSRMSNTSISASGKDTKQFHLSSSRKPQGWQIFSLS